MKAIFYIIVLVLSLFLLAQFSYSALERWSNLKHNIQGEVIIDFSNGAKLNQLASQLRAKDIISNDLLFRLWVRYFSDYSKFQAGKYRFNGQLSPREIVAFFIMGDTYNPIVYELTIPEGYTFKQISQKLVSAGISSFEELNILKNDKEFLASLKVPVLEGYLYPATYSFTEVPNAKKVIVIAVNEFWKRLPADYEQRVNALGLTLEQAVIFASLIELETPNLEEKPLVSEVIWRRLSNGATLGIDATLIYGIADYNGNLTRRHLEDSSNPYNTRIHIGLPPTAIGSPDLSSLLAVLNPSNEGYYYYVLDPSSGNGHHFSKTISEHNNYVRALVEYSRRRGNSNEN